MQITQCDTAGRVFWVQDVVPQSLVQKIISIDWASLPWQPGVMQEEWKRRQIQPRCHAVMEEMAHEMHNVISEIQDFCGIEFEVAPDTMWWLDMPGFSVTTHTDGELPAAMQLFWMAPGPQYGTVFYNKPNSEVLKRFEFLPNSGYLMLNQHNIDGSQPLLWHGMGNSVPTGFTRLTTYHVLGNYQHK